VVVADFGTDGRDLRWRDKPLAMDHPEEGSKAIPDKIRTTKRKGLWRISIAP
jgi:hypothetical protein